MASKFANLSELILNTTRLIALERTFGHPSQSEHALLNDLKPLYRLVLEDELSDVPNVEIDLVEIRHGTKSVTFDAYFRNYNKLPVDRDISFSMEFDFESDHIRYTGLGKLRDDDGKELLRRTIIQEEITRNPHAVKILLDTLMSESLEI